MSATKGRKERQLEIDTSEMNVLFVHSAIDDYPLSPEEFRLYAHLARRAGSGAAYPSLESMARKCRMHKDTARRCLHNLLAYKMLDAHERRGQTTLYTLTKISRWVKPDVVLALQEKQAQEGKAKRALKKAAKQTDPADPSETKGGVQEAAAEATPPKRREGYPSEMEGGHPSVTKGDEVNPLRGSIEGDPSSKSEANFEGAGYARTQVPEAGDSFPGADDDFSPGGSNEEADQIDVEVWASKTHLPSLDQSDEMEGTKLDPVTEVEKGSAAAAGGLAALVSVSRAEMEAREPRNMEEHTQFRALMSASHRTRLDYLRAELAGATRSGIPMHLMTRLTDAEIEMATVAAREEAAMREGVTFATAARRALERLIGEPLASTAPRTQPSAAVTPNGSSLDDAASTRQQAAALADVQEGSVWYGRKSGKPFTVESNLHGMIRVAGIDAEYNPQRFHQNFVQNFVAEASA